MIVFKTTIMKRVSLLAFKRYRYFKVSSLLMALAVIAYLFDNPDPEPFGGTVLGYILGILATLIVIFLLLYGIRKRITPLSATRKERGSWDNFFVGNRTKSLHAFYSQSK